jgi:putative pyruvate formate lyase activating enzyme
MAQYTPCGDLTRFPELDRRLTPGVGAAMDALNASDITDGYVQELSAAGEEAIPAFDGTGVNDI